MLKNKHEAINRSSFITKTTNSFFRSCKCYIFKHQQTSKADIPSKTLSDDTPGQTANHYDQFFGPLYFEPYAIEVAKRIDPAGVAVVLEIAAGTGRVTRHIREHILPSTKLIASDISGEMLAVAKKKLGHLDIDW